MSLQCMASTDAGQFHYPITFENCIVTQILTPKDDLIVSYDIMSSRNNLK